MNNKGKGSILKTFSVNYEHLNYRCYFSSVQTIELGCLSVQALKQHISRGGFSNRFLQSARVICQH